MVRSEKDVRAFPSAGGPVVEDTGRQSSGRRVKVWTFELDDGRVASFDNNNCPGCGFRLHRFSRESLIAVAAGERRQASRH